MTVSSLKRTTNKQKKTGKKAFLVALSRGEKKNAQIAAAEKNADADDGRATLDFY